MSNKAQKRKERHEQRRKEKRKKETQHRQQEQARQLGYDRQVASTLATTSQHRQRVQQQVPKAWPGETTADVAIFDDTVLATLAPEVVQEVTAVRDALEFISNSRSDDALKAVSSIPRSSPVSEWRLFIRGLVDWLAGASDAAAEAWKRLDFERRPGRIATTMMLALRSDLQALSPAPVTQAHPNEQPPGSPWDQFDAQQLYHGKLLRHVRFDRTALHAAEAGLKVPEESRDMLIGPRKLEWLRKFIAEYEETEPSLVNALAQGALGKAFAQDFSDLFDDAARYIRGPRHDPHNLLMRFHYYRRFVNDPHAEDTSARALDRYLDEELPNNPDLPPALRSAIASQIHLYEARSMMRPRNMGIMHIFLPEEEPREIRDHLRAAAKAYPANAAVYEAHVDWITGHLDNDRLTKPERTKLQNELPVVMATWSKNMPDDIEPRLWLVDDYLENEELDQARPHVEYLASARLDDPRVRALPWKWELLEAMRMCRRKAWLPEVPAKLGEVEALWPAWLPKQWLPYLKAALMLRNQQPEQYEEQRRQICESSGVIRDSLADACLMLGAAQRLRATTSELVPLRAALQQALDNLKSSPLEELIQAAAAFWDLYRAQILYPAYRMHSKDVGKALFARIDKSPSDIINRIDEDVIQKAILWGSAHRYWAGSRYASKIPRFLSDPKLKDLPIVRAAILNATLQENYQWGVKKLEDTGPLLRISARTQPDPYYRFWFNDLAQRLDDALDKMNRESKFSFANMFGFGTGGDDDSDDEPM